MVRWSDALLGMDGQALLENYRIQSQKWFLPKLLGMNQLKKQLAAASKGKLSEEILGQDLERLVEYQKEKAAADGLFAQVGRGLGSLYRGEATDWARISTLTGDAEADFRKADRLEGFDGLRGRFGTNQEALERSKAFRSVWECVLQSKRGLYELLDLSRRRAGSGFPPKRSNVTGLQATRTSSESGLFGTGLPQRRRRIWRAFWTTAWR